ncbi:CBS domain-containing protein [Desulforhopalus singaporensis]|uniref:CBS domain-containing protein n=1 Tax=Desulforhopalus singaporensis TaxID=91360 RepID=A0A1H0LV07_9BACT|nr:CBS domain-containing protein [Desulforhopalus singaporensis]SDO72022.1 CBS domain-containing protein [Desulforhopalus singaporensis]
MSENKQLPVIAADISEGDIIKAMKAIPGYIDITPGDFREIYHVAHTLAVQRMLDSVTASGLMTSPVLSIEQTTQLAEAARMLASNQITGAPVVDSEKKVVGVISEKNFLIEMGLGASPSFMQIATHCLHDKSCLVARLHGRTVRDIMTQPAITGDKQMTIGEISAIFTRQKINRIPIVDRDGTVVGIVTRTDLTHGFHIFSQGL